MSLSGDKILEGVSQTMSVREKVPTPQWAEPHVYVRKLPAKELARVQSLFPEQDAEAADSADVFAGWCVLCACDEEGTLLFEESHIPQLLEGPFAPLLACAQAAMRLNGLDTESQREMAKNSPEGQSVDSPST